MSEPQPPVLDYRSAGSRGPTKTGWLRRLNRGEDSFLACSALFFAVLVWAVAILGLVSGAGIVNCLNVSLVLLSVVLGLAGLLESATSKTFPLASLALNGAYVLWVVAFMVFK